MKNSARPHGSAAAEWVRRLHREHAETAERFFLEGVAAVESAAEALITAFRGGHTLLFFGNGGSAADAQHLAAEFVNRYVRDRPALAAVALTTDTSVLTSIANDTDFKSVFARQVEAIGRPGDVAIGISTSGQSANVLEGLRVARSKRLVTIGFCGEECGAMRAHCDYLISVPSRTTARVQEVHILVGHILCQIVDETLYPST